MPPQQQWNPQQPLFPQQQYQQPGPSPDDQKYQHYQNELATVWLFLIWPVGVYLMWKHASWSTATKKWIAMFA
jgi:hypothetical protein